MYPDQGGGGSSPRPQPVQRGQTFRPRSRPSANSGGNYGGGASGGGAPQPVISNNNSGQVSRVGRRPSPRPIPGNPGNPNPGPGIPNPSPSKGGPRHGDVNTSMLGDGDKGDNGGKGNKGPKEGSVAAYLGTDEQYQADRADLIKNFRNLKLTNKENRGNLGLDRQTTLSRMGSEQEDALEAMKADFAARGLFGGAEYQSKLGDFNEDYSNQRFDTNQSFQRNIAQLLKDLSNAGTLKQSNLQQARLEAIRRRAAELGVTG